MNHIARAISTIAIMFFISSSGAHWIIWIIGLVTIAEIWGEVGGNHKGK